MEAKAAAREAAQRKAAEAAAAKAQAQAQRAREEQARREQVEATRAAEAKARARRDAHLSRTFNSPQLLWQQMGGRSPVPRLRTLQAAEKASSLAKYSGMGARLTRF
jgi:hypothetical protein